MAKKIALGVLVLLIIAGIYAYQHFAGWAKNMAEDIASNALGVKVTISSIDMNWKERVIAVNNIEINNPRGFTDDNAVQIDTVRIQAGALSREQVMFSDISISGTDIYLEYTDPKTNNLDIIKRNLAAKPKSDKGTQVVKVIIEKIAFTEAKLHPRISFLPRTFDPITLPPIRLNGIGQKDNAVVAGEAVDIIMRHVIDVAIKNAARSGVLKDMVKDEIKKYEDKANTIKDAIKNPEESLKKVFDF